MDEGLLWACCCHSWVAAACCWSAGSLLWLAGGVLQLAESWLLLDGHGSGRPGSDCCCPATAAPGGGRGQGKLQGCGLPVRVRNCGTKAGLSRTATWSMERRKRWSFWGFGGSPTWREMTVDVEEVLLSSSEVVSAVSSSALVETSE